MRHSRGSNIAAGIAVAALTLSACGSGGGDAKPIAKPSLEAGTTMAKISAAGKMKVGTKFDQPGFGLKGLDGKLSGFDVEVAKIIGNAMGVTGDNIEWVESPSKVREELIEKGKVDLVAATYTINDKRKKRVTFAGPYYIAGQQLMVKSDNPKIKGAADLKANPDQKVCSVTGSTPSEEIKKYLATPSQLVLFDVYDKCADALRTNQVQAVTTDNVILLGFVSKSDKAFKLVGKQFTKEPYGIGIKKGDIKFCQFINKTLKDNKAAYDKAWNDTAGKVEGATQPQLPAAAKCS
ncbi:MAG: glutamate transport system substrate-binding protein [Actinomycetota bacterium]|jgi:glutamate transport system substrate-binding protein|nr:glutamate transport system substrate-binding protein [Actinomycetota bacterium]